MSGVPDLNTLSNLSYSELEGLWSTHLGGTVPKHLPKFLLPKLLAFRLQEQQLGGLNKRAARFLDQVADDLEADRVPPLPYPVANKLKPGCVIIREHDGHHHRVMVLENGFAWNGKTYGSLSAVAKAITGTNWNGQRFFGLKEKRQIAEGVAP